MWIITLILVLIFLIVSRKRREALRADYNRKIGQPDLNAPTPSEAHATQRSIHGLLKPTALGCALYTSERSCVVGHTIWRSCSTSSDTDGAPCIPNASICARMRCLQ
jgi:hypothetical protein